MNDLITCQKAVSAILDYAMLDDRDYTDRFGNLQWCKVEQAILEAIDQHWPELEDDGK